jgi:hypothetical protein
LEKKVKFLIFIFISIFVLPQAAFPEHEADHRYFVSGFVRDDAGTPKADVAVSVEHKGGQKKKATTNRRGYYEVMFHLHNDNLGDEIVITAGSDVKKHIMAFDPGDHFSERRGEINFGAPGKESPYAWIYWTGGIALVAGVAVGLRSLRKKKKVKKEPARKKKK